MARALLGWLLPAFLCLVGGRKTLGCLDAKKSARIADPSNEVG